MAKDQLVELLREKKAKAQPSGINWAAKRDDWIGAVDALYDTIVKEYLRGSENDVEIDYAKKTVTEDHVGQYSIRELILRVGDQIVVFSPTGTTIVGANGRIDIRGERMDATIVRQQGGQWSIVAARTPTLRLVPLTAESLTEVLREIMR